MTLVETILLWCEIVLIFFLWIGRNIKARYSDSVTCLVGKTAIVTGGAEGIGYETCKLLASRGCKIIIACRSDATEAISNLIKLTDNPNIHYKKLDLSSLKSVRNFAKEIREEEHKIDILINNSGVGALASKITEDGLNPLMQTNYFGAFLLTHLLLEPLKSSRNGRVIFLTSGLAFFNNLTLDNLNPTKYEFGSKTEVFLYSNSKFMNTFAAQEFATRFSKYGIMFNSADTGTTRTLIFRKTLMEIKGWAQILLPIILSPVYKDQFTAAQSSFHLASSEKLKDETGQLYFHCRPFMKHRKLKNKEFCDQLWEQSEKLVKLGPEERL